MLSNLSVKEAGRRVLHLTFQDGLWDIFIGWLMLFGGIRSLTDNAWFSLAALGSALLYMGGKLLITAPRLGRVKFGPALRARVGIARLVIVIAVLGTFFLLALGLSGRHPSAKVVGPLMAVGVTAVFLLIAYVWDFRRLYAYSVLIGISIALEETVGRPIGPIAGCVVGGIALLVGLVVLIRFLHDYPIPVEGSPAEEAGDVNP